MADYARYGLMYHVDGTFEGGLFQVRDGLLNVGKVPFLAVAVNGSAQNEKLNNTAKWWRYSDLILLIEKYVE